MYCIEKIRKKLEKKKYSLFGNSSGVQICRWTKNSLNNKGVCWKEKFYGVESHLCCQMSPAIMWCENSCVHCWRPIELNLGTELGKIDDPVEIIDGIVEARKKLLEGFGGNEGVSKKKLREAYEPRLFTMSLSGEPTIYPRLGEMFAEIRRRGAVSFLVTNGLNPNAILGLDKKGGELPTQITISTNAPNKKLFDKWHNSRKVNAWRVFNESLEVLKSLENKVRRVVRLTLVKKGSENSPLKGMTNMSEENVLEYANLIKKASPDFVHVKGFMSVGYSRDRGMGYDKQPWFEEVKDYALKILEKLEGYGVGAEDERSCVVMLVKKGKNLRIEKV